MADKLKHTRSIATMYNCLWQEWVYSFGACMIVIVSAFVLPQFVVPSIALIMAWALNASAEYIRRKNNAHCLLIVKQTSRALVLATFLMIVCIFIGRRYIFTGLFIHETLNKDLPYVSTIIVSVSMALTLSSFMIARDYNRHCSSCRVRHGLSPKEAFVGNLIHNESKYQIRLAAYISSAIAIESLIYYFVEYSNDRITGLDIFYYIVVPGILFVLSTLYLVGMYQYRLHTLKGGNLEVGNRRVTSLRYLVLRGDTLLLAEVPNKLVPDTLTTDTPATVNIEYTESVSQNVAHAEFAKLSGMETFWMRDLYNNDSFTGCANVFHYAVVVDDKSPLPSDWSLGDKWVTLDQINRLWRSAMISPALAAEVHRIYTVTMAWKTYSRDGMRLYPIKNYRPTFRLRDFKNWDVDYSDMHWIYIADNNQDKPIFKLRKFVRKITSLHAK